MPHVAGGERCVLRDRYTGNHGVTGFLHPSFFAAVYTANAIVSDNGFVEVVRVDAASQVAQPTGPNNTGGSRNERNR